MVSLSMLIYLLANVLHNTLSNKKVLRLVIMYYMAISKLAVRVIDNREHVKLL